MRGAGVSDDRSTTDLRTLERHGWIDLVLLIGAIFLMATARYW